MNHEEVTATGRLDEVLKGLSRLGGRRGRGSNNGGTGSRQFGLAESKCQYGVTRTFSETYSDETDSLNIGILVLGGGIITDGAQFLPDGFTQQQTDTSAPLLLHRHGQCSGDGVLARVVETGQQDGETLLVSRRVGFSQDLDNGLVREPVGNRTTGDQTPSQFSAGDVGGGSTLGDFIDWLVFVSLGQVGDHLEGHHLDVEFVLELRDQLLRVVLSKQPRVRLNPNPERVSTYRTVEVLSSRVLTRTGVISTDDLSSDVRHVSQSANYFETHRHTK